MSLASTKSSGTEKTLKRLPSAAHYTEDILHERLVYITKIMRENEQSRVLTPTSLLLLGSYQATIGMYLHFPDHMVDRDECMAKMMSIDEFFEENNGMLEKMDPERIEMEDKMTQLKRLEFYARYGDYFGGELKVLKDNALKMQTEDHNELRQYWTEIAPKIRREKWTAENNSEEAKIPHNVKTWNAVHSAAVAIGQDPEYIYRVIMGYAARNEIVHGPVDSYFQGAKFMDLAQRLHQDEQLLARMKHMVPPGEIAALQGIITRKIDKYFTRSDDPKFRDNYQTWTIKELGWEVVRSKERAEEERQKDLKAMNEQRRRAEENRLKRARVIDDLINDNWRTRKKLEDDFSPEQMEVWQSNSNDMKAVTSIKQRSIADF